MDNIRRDIVGLALFHRLGLLPGALKGERTLDDIGDLVGIGVDVPGQDRARGEGIKLRLDLLARVAGEVFDEQVLGLDRVGPSPSRASTRPPPANAPLSIPSSNATMTALLIRMISPPAS